MGHLNCLQYAYEHGCSITQETVLQARRYQQWHCLQYIANQVS